MGPCPVRIALSKKDYVEKCVHDDPYMDFQMGIINYCEAVLHETL